MDHLIEKTINTRDIYKGKIIDLQIEDVLLPDGGKSTREIVRHPGAVAVIAVTEDKKALMVRQYRKALGKVITEIPAGKLEKGEDPLESAKRELLEETGYTCREMKKIASFYTSPGFADEIITVYFTDSLIYKGEQNTDEDEFIDVLELTAAEISELIEKEEIHDAKTMYAAMYLQMKYDR
ncbi:NUDIX domain-containing protein [Fictibacillus aquaticus]|uniref:ADP-ribose pyrophosphatase n=1 Tax=Fictibacillus aquaticus TaxID=2021314 RepID=A0A235FC72_9BACL|nr:NUDIX hydrolase [Fictibacillus aquaticus]OYD58385.1 ADP-ribose pyrophosphatase [Fictibacillus aquaticus]